MQAIEQLRDAERACFGHGGTSNAPGKTSIKSGGGSGVKLRGLSKDEAESKMREAMGAVRTALLHLPPVMQHAVAAMEQCLADVSVTGEHTSTRSFCLFLNSDFDTLASCELKQSGFLAGSDPGIDPMHIVVKFFHLDAEN